jgi:hypothetical protein
VAHEDRYLLFIGPDYGELMRVLQAEGRYTAEVRAAYRRTRVLASHDPLSFELAGQVATVDSHAAEVVEDPDGGWWVSHCGWGEGGVHLAPLTWRSPRR